MKLGAIVIKMASGELQAIPFDSTVPMLDAAKRIRDSGCIGEGKKAQAVVSGVAIASDTPCGTVMRFRCQPKA
jgi:hypothetical protein